MTTLNLTKHHGLGNDFLVIFDHDDQGPVDLPTDMASLARDLCDRRRGIGADGLLVASGSASHAANMVLYNADGSLAEMSGNGIRCFAQAVAMRRGDLDAQLIMTDAGERLVTLAVGEDDNTLMATVDMGPVTSVDAPNGWDEFGTNPDRPVAHYSLGNPHSVVAVDDVDDVDLSALGGKVPHVNLEIVAPTAQPGMIRMRVHERGAGITEACGTGACAAATAAAAWGLAEPVDGKLIVDMDGGSAIVALDVPAVGRATLTGPAVYVGAISVKV